MVCTIFQINVNLVTANDSSTFQESGNIRENEMNKVPHGNLKYVIDFPNVEERETLDVSIFLVDFVCLHKCLLDVVRTFLWFRLV